MEELLASLKTKFITLNRGDQVEGEIISKNDKEAILDLGTKSEGVILAKELPNFADLKIGSKISAFVVESENESGQVILSTQKATPKISSSRDRSPLWNKFITAKDKKTLFTGKVIELNKGGLVVEVEGMRGFLPTSLAASELQIGQDAQVFVTEIDPLQNRLIFSQKTEISDEQFAQIVKKYQPEQVVKGVVKQIGRAAFVIELEDGTKGFLPSSKAEGTTFEVGQPVSVMIDSIDKARKRVNLVPFVTSTAGLIYK